MMSWLNGWFNMEWLKAIPFAVVLTGVFGMIWSLVKSRIFGSRRSERNWTRDREEKGGKMMYMGCKRFRRDTPYSEGDSAGVHFQTFTGYVYKTVGNVRYCFRRSYIIVVYCYNQWETEGKKLGANLMNEFCSRPMPCMGLKEETDAKGNKYWEPIPVADVQVPELTITLMPPPQAVT
jgi:hypothetical protein